LPEVKHARAKVVLVGDAAAKKTELIRPFVEHGFDKTYLRTLGAVVSRKALTVVQPDGAGKVEMEFAVWDIADTLSFLDLSKEPFFAGTRGVLAICDYMVWSTIANLRTWIEAVYTVAGKVPTFILVREGVPNLRKSLRLRHDKIVEAADACGASFAFVPQDPGLSREVVEGAFRWMAERLANKA
jgi:GTPase SAR1 family protein